MSEQHPELPKVDDSVVDEAGVDAVFAGIERDGADVEILIKGDVGRHASAGGATLGQARELLREGAVLAVQIRYRVGEARRIDTLMHVPHGVRVVSLEEPA